MALPVNIRDLAKAGAKIREDREKPVRIAIVVEADAADELVEVVRSRMHPFTAGATLQIEVVEPGVKLLIDSSADVVVGVAGSGRLGMKEQLAATRTRSIPTVALALTEDRDDAADRLDHPYLDTLVDSDAVHLVEEELGEWLTEHVSGKRLAMAANFAFMRRAVSEEAVKATAFQNALIGGVAIIPGADMPLMTANQAKMIMQIAAAFGEEIGTERIKELAAVVGGGFALRAVARQALTFVPVLGWAVKGGFGYGGTLAMGYAAIKYFEGGADLSEVTEQLAHLKRRAVETKDRAVKRLRSADLPETILDAEGVAVEPLPEIEDGQ